MKCCGKCRLVKPLEEFHLSKAKGRQSYCKACNALWVRKRYLSDKGYYRRLNDARKLATIIRICNLLKLSGCVDCGERDILTLDFDHVRGIKTHNVSYLVKLGVAWAKILTEIEKCDIRCANCHRRKTARTFNWAKLLFVE
jgi:hypothetical protein